MLCTCIYHHKTFIFFKVRANILEMEKSTETLFFSAFLLLVSVFSPCMPFGEWVEESGWSWRGQSTSQPLKEKFVFDMTTGKQQHSHTDVNAHTNQTHLLMRFPVTSVKEGTSASKWPVDPWVGCTLTRYTAVSVGSKLVRYLREVTLPFTVTFT